MPTKPDNPAPAVEKSLGGAIHKSTMISNSSPLKPISQGGRSFTAVISTDEPDLVGDIVENDWDLSVYKHNPQLKSEHMQVTVGAMDSLETRMMPNGKNRMTVATFTLVPEGTSQAGDEAGRLIACGAIRAVSVGFTCANASPIDPTRPRGGTRWKGPNLLLEVSLVGLPAQPSAVITSKALFMSPTATNPEKAARQKRVAEVVERGARRERAHQVALRGREIAKEIAVAEKLAGPHPTDGMSTADRRRWAAERVARSAPSALTATGSLPAAEVEAQRNARHAAGAYAERQETNPDRSNRVIRAGLADKKTRGAGHGGS